MRTEEFNKCREFLEGQIIRTPDNKELISAYQKLLELKSIYDTKIHTSILEKKKRDTEAQQQIKTNTALAAEIDNSLKSNSQNLTEVRPDRSNSMLNQKNWYDFMQVQQHHFGNS